MKKSIISLNSSMRTDNVNAEKLLKHAQSVAEGIVVPAGIEFAKFEFGGRTYAICARVEVEVNLLTAQVSDRVYRDGDMRKALELKKQQEREGRKP